MNLEESHWSGEDSLMWWGYERQFYLRRWDFAKFSLNRKKHWSLKIQALILEHLGLIMKCKTKSIWDKKLKYVVLCERLLFVIKKENHFILLTERVLLLIKTGSLKDML